MLADLSLLNLDITTIATVCTAVVVIGVIIIATVRNKRAK